MMVFLGKWSTDSMVLLRFFIFFRFYFSLPFWWFPVTVNCSKRSIFRGSCYAGPTVRFGITYELREVRSRSKITTHPVTLLPGSLMHYDEQRYIHASGKKTVFPGIKLWWPTCTPQANQKGHIMNRSIFNFELGSNQPTTNHHSSCTLPKTYIFYPLSDLSKGPSNVQWFGPGATRKNTRATCIWCNR